MPLIKKSIAQNISNKVGLSQKDSLSFVNYFFKAITSSSNKKININNFGTFACKTTPRRIGRNPKTLEEFEIKPRVKLTFSPANGIKKDIN